VILWHYWFTLRHSPSYPVLLGEEVAHFAPVGWPSLVRNPGPLCSGRVAHFAPAHACKALDSISSVLKSSRDERLAECTFKAVFRIIAETDDKETKEKASGIFKESSKSMKESAFKQMVEKCINEFKAENKADLQASAERRARLDRFVGDLQI